jgi:hypothetical protein
MAVSYTLVPKMGNMSDLVYILPYLCVESP